MTCLQGTKCQRSRDEGTAGSVGSGKLLFCKCKMFLSCSVIICVIVVGFFPRTVTDVIQNANAWVKRRAWGEAKAAFRFGKWMQEFGNGKVNSSWLYLFCHFYIGNNLLGFFFNIIKYVCYW